MLPPVEELFQRWRDAGDHRALAQVFDRTAPELWRVAVHLAADRTEAEDLVQTAFLAAMQSASHWRADQPLVPWLCGILANKLRMQRRRARQEVPQRASAAPTDDPVAAAERGELRALLRERIERLDEPYRAVLVLQLEHGLTAAEIAQALGRPRATVRSQMHRGLELLRRGLPLGLFGGAARAIAMPGLGAVRVAVLAAAGGGASAGTLVSIGAMLMAKKLLAAGIVVLAAIVGMWWAWPPAGAVSSEREAAVLPSPVASKVGAVAKNPGPEPPTQRASASPLPVALATGGLRVQVRWSDGSPAIGMEVAIEPPYRAGGFLAQRRAVSDGAGLVAWTNLAPDTFVVQSRHGGEVQVDVKAGEVAACELEIPAGVDLRGVVVDPEGQLVPRATIVLGQANIGGTSDRLVEVTRADGNGAFHLRSVPATWLVAAFAEGFYGSAAQSVADLLGKAPVQLQLGIAGAAAEGRVVDERGVGIEGAWVAEGFLSLSGRSQRPLQVVRTDATGRFRVLGLLFGRQSFLHAGAAGRVSWRGEVWIDAGASPFVQIRLVRGATLRGVARTLAGQPVPNPSISRVRDANALDKEMHDFRPRWCHPRVVSDPTGAFVVDQLAPGEVGLAVADDRGVLSAYGEFTVQTGETHVWDAVLEPSPTLRGTLVDADGAPLQGWRLMADGPPGGPSPRSLPTGSDGTFTLGPCLPTSYTLLVYGANPLWNPPVHRVAVVASEDPLLLRVPRECVPSCLVCGMVAAGTTEGSVVVRLFDRATDNSISAEVVAGAPFELGPVPSGGYGLQVEASLGGTSRVAAVVAQPDLAPGQRWDVGTVRLPLPGTVDVELLDIEGRPVDRTQLCLGSCEASRWAALVPIVAGRGSVAATPGTYELYPYVQADDLHFEHPLIEVRSGERVAVRARLVKTLRRSLLCDVTASAGAPTVAIATLRKDGVAMVRQRWHFWSAAPRPMSRRFSPGNWELELELARGRAERFPFVVTADTEAPPIEIRLQPR